MAAVADASRFTPPPLVPPPGLTDPSSPAKVELQDCRTSSPKASLIPESISDQSLPCYAPMHSAVAGAPFQLGVSMYAQAGLFAMPPVQGAAGYMQWPAFDEKEPLLCALAPIDKAHSQSGRGIEKEAAGTAWKVQTLSTSLQVLSNEDPDCLFVVRRINKLGFKAARALKQHFSFYGSVVRVLVAHSTVRQHGDVERHARRRPSSLGFVQMASAEAVQQVLSIGEVQQVGGAVILVQRFERQHVTGDADVEEDGTEADPTSKEQCRRVSSNSEVSTVASSISLSDSL